MPGHEDPQGKIMRAEDGFLYVKSIKDDVQEEPEEEQEEEKDIDDIRTKDAMEEYGRKHGIELDKRRKLKDMKEDFQKAMAEKDEELSE